MLHTQVLLQTTLQTLNQLHKVHNINLNIAHQTLLHESTTFSLPMSVLPPKNG